MPKPTKRTRFTWAADALLTFWYTTHDPRVLDRYLWVVSWLEEK